VLAVTAIEHVHETVVRAERIAGSQFAVRTPHRARRLHQQVDHEHHGEQRPAQRTKDDRAQQASIPGVKEGGFLAEAHQRLVRDDLIPKGWFRLHSASVKQRGEADGP
jgi:hypothetical protein